jgi:hypothetical protein
MNVDAVVGQLTDDEKALLRKVRLNPYGNLPTSAPSDMVGHLQGLGLIEWTGDRWGWCLTADGNTVARHHL